MNTLRRPRAVDLEQLEDAIRLASKAMKFARRCVQRAARAQKGQDNAHRKPSRCQTETRRRRSGPERIDPAPGYTPDKLPPVGEKWVHIGDGAFITLRLYKEGLKQQQRDRDWNS